MAKVYELAFRIGATLSSGFGTTMLSASSGLKGLEGRLKTLGQQTEAIKRFRQLEDKTAKARVAMTAADAEVARLRDEVAKAGTPTKELAKALAGAEKKATAVSAAFDRETGALGNARDKLDKVKVSTTNLAAMQALSRPRPRS